MFNKLFLTDAACRRYCEAPFAAERERYLTHCADLGATVNSLRVKCIELLWVAHHLPRNVSQGFGIEELQELGRQRTSVCKGATAAHRVITTVRPWLRFLKWWREPTVNVPYQSELNQYTAWMRDEKGFTPLTVGRWRGYVVKFLQWCAATDRQLRNLQSIDIDHYFVSEGAQRWSRVTVSSIASALRSFLRYAGTQGMSAPRLPETIRSPRAYKLESLPYSPGWPDVQRILAATLTDQPRDIRDRAILMLLSIYGLRSGEVASLCLEHIDWHGRVLRVHRLKCRQPQVYPLLPSVAQALARYIDTCRPKATTYKEVFIKLNSPFRPLTAGIIYHIVRRQFDAFGIHTAHRGPSCLRNSLGRRRLNHQGDWRPPRSPQYVSHHDLR